MEAYIGTILPVAIPYAPQGWALCNGQTMAISQYAAVFSLLGTAFGGDGRSTFCLPDLRGRTLVGTGQNPQAPGINLAMGQVTGTTSATVTGTANASFTLNVANLPAHGHDVAVDASQFTAASTLHVTSSGPGSTTPTEGYLIGSGGNAGAGQAAIYFNGGTANVALGSGSVTTGLSGKPTFTSTQTGTGTPVSVQSQLAAQPVSVVQPSLGINYIICLNGIFPPRN